MFLLAKEIGQENVIIGTAQRRVAVSSSSPDIMVFEISDDEYTPDMINAKIDSFEEDE